MPPVPMAFAESQGRAGRVVVRPLRRREAEAAAARLAGRARDELFLLDIVRQLGTSAEVEAVGAWRDATLLGVAALRPTLVIESALEPDVADALAEPLAGTGAGLLRCETHAAARLWSRLVVRGRRAVVDRREQALVLERAAFREPPLPDGVAVRAATPADLDPLVEAARASLREEGRPDPFLGDPRGFRRWVAARVGRARIGTHRGVPAWAGYADVRLAEGHLLQGVYTWPAERRRGIAAAGVASLCRAAFDAGADHVQLSVVQGNDAALALYAKLGFRPHAMLRTVLFA